MSEAIELGQILTAIIRTYINIGKLHVTHVNCVRVGPFHMRSPGKDTCVCR